MTQATTKVSNHVEELEVGGWTCVPVRKCRLLGPSPWQIAVDKMGCDQSDTAGGGGSGWECRQHQLDLGGSISDVLTVVGAWHVGQATK